MTLYSFGDPAYRTWASHKPPPFEGTMKNHFSLVLLRLFVPVFSVILSPLVGISSKVIFCLFVCARSAYLVSTSTFQSVWREIISR